MSRYADSPDPHKVIAYLEAQKRRGRPGEQQYTLNITTFANNRASRQYLPSDFAAGFYVSGLNLTEDAPYVLLHPFQNMRKMTEEALSLLLRWASEQRPGREVGGVNVLCCDFVDVSEFCSLVIGLNYKLLGGATDVCL